MLNAADAVRCSAVSLFSSPRSPITAAQGFFAPFFQQRGEMGKISAIARYFCTSWKVLFDKRAPTPAKFAPLIRLPLINIAEDFLPVLGWLDDGLAM